jgi:hyaluronan synthase
MISFLTSAGWLTFIIIFAIFAKALWFYYYFSLYAFKPKEYKEEYKGKVALIVPAYNEEAWVLKETIEHVNRVKGVDQIIFVNDGSDKNNVVETLMRYCDGKYDILNLTKNVGKRRAQYEAISKLSNDIEVVVFMDSDTLLQEDSIIELTRPMVDNDIGGTTACILVSNKNKNFLTKCVSAMYWTASNVWRKAPSNLGYIQVTNGQLSCYRKDLLLKIMPNYINQFFLGVKCRISDDRYITHYIQTQFNKKIIYTEKSIVFTHLPIKYYNTYKMMLRWKQGAIRESFLVLKQIKKHPVLVLDIWAGRIIYLFQVMIRLMVICLAFFYPIVLLYYLFSIIVVSLMYSFDMIFSNTKELGYRLVYSVMNEFYFSWTELHAYFTIRNQGTWATR